MESLINSKFGLVDFVFEQAAEYGNNGVFSYVAKTSNTAAFTADKNFAETGGVALNRTDAKMKAIGEGIERYCSAIYNTDHFKHSTFSEATFDCVPPHKFALYTDKQYQEKNFPFNPFTEKTKLNWVPSISLFSGKEVYVPANLVYVPYTHGPDDAAIAQSISTGLACHVNYTKAMVSGICEVIERDAFSITWQAMLSPPQIRLDSLSPINQRLLTVLQSWYEDITLFNITTDLKVPSILAVARNQNKALPAVIVAASSHPKAEIAIKKSLEELAHTGKYMQQLHIQEESIEVKEGEYNKVDQQIAHLNFWCQHQHQDKINFLFEDHKRIGCDEIVGCLEEGDEAALQFLCQKIEAVNEEVYITDVTTHDVRQLGYCVIRAIVPGLNRLVLGHHIRCCGGERLRTVPQSLGGYESKENPYPHPFP